MTNNNCIIEGCTEERLNRRTQCREHYNEYTSEYRKNYYQENKEQSSEYMKAYRKANPEKIKETQENWRRANEGHTYLSTDGYVHYIGYEHPATAPSGITRYHRIVLWDKLKGEDAPCHWCEMPLYWSKTHPVPDALIVDHLNEVTNDNSPENLVPSCGPCNSSRRTKSVSRTTLGTCEGPECDREARSHNKDKTLVLCGSHYNQTRAGKALTPLRKHVRTEVTDDGRVCTQCLEFKEWSEFYLRVSGKPQERCKVCFIARTKAAKAKREAQGIPCSVEGCTAPVDLKELCTNHYLKQYKEAKSK